MIKELIDTYVEEFHYDTVERNDSYILKRGYFDREDIERLFPELEDKYPFFFNRLFKTIANKFPEWRESNGY